VKTASPHTLNPQPIAQSVVGGHIGYHLTVNKRRVFYSLELVEAMYEQNLMIPVPVDPPRALKFGIKHIVIAMIAMIVVMSITTVNVTLTADNSENEKNSSQH
jgi:hypothetical protein